MAIIDERLAQQLRERFADRLRGPVELRLVTRPGTGRLILPSGYGCATCDDARELVEAIAATAPDHLTVDIVDVSEHPESDAEDVPTLALAAPGEPARIRFQGLPAGFEFATVIDAIERLSANEHGLGPLSVEALEHVTEDIEVMVFATPT
jgi:alkyl hydroperoxide reductase subunit AhpF